MDDDKYGPDTRMLRRFAYVRFVSTKAKYLPWIIVFLTLLATALSFLDRQVLSVSIIRIKEDFSITDTEYGLINTGFLISYALMFTLGGILIDRFGSRLGLAF